MSFQFNEEIEKKFRPLSDRVLIRRDAAEETTKSGLIIVPQAREAPLVGTVVRTGPGFRKEDGTVREPVVKAGDRVIFGKYAGEGGGEGTKYVLCREGEIHAILEEE